MIVKVGGCFGGVSPGRNSVGFLLNGRLLLEGGTATSVFTPGEQAAISDIVISHIHLDHTKEIFFLLDNLAQMGVETVTLAGAREVVEGARRYLFNEQIWPDFSMLPSEDSPVLRFRELPEEEFSTVGEFEIMPVRVNHTVPATGFIVRDRGGALLYTGDTGPTERIWEAGKGAEDLKAVFAEASFPNSLERLALASGHLTPRLLGEQLRQLGKGDVPVYVFHMKPVFLEEIRKELEELALDHLRILEEGVSYDL